MSNNQIALLHGFHYIGDCKPCGGKFGIFKNPEYPQYELRIHKTKNFVRIKKGNQLVAQANSATLETELKRLNLVREGLAV